MDIDKIQGAWGCDVDSVEFVRRLRKSRRIEPIWYDCPLPGGCCNCRTPGQCQYCGEAYFGTELLCPGTTAYTLIEACETLADMFGWQQRWRDD